MNNSGTTVRIDSIKKEDRRALLEIYKIFFPQVRHYILSNSGNIFDAEDVFQDALVIIYLKIKNDTFVLRTSFGTYLNNIVRFLWLKELERKRKYFGTSPDVMADNIPDDKDFHQDLMWLERRKLILDHYLELTDDCKKILKLFIKGTPIYLITSIMGYSSEQYTKNRRTTCKERLVKTIWNDPRFNDLKNEAYQQDTKVPRW